MKKSHNPEVIFRQAVATFPYKNLTSRKITKGNFTDQQALAEYSEEFTFEFRPLFGRRHVATGRIVWGRRLPMDCCVLAMFVATPADDLKKPAHLRARKWVEGMYYPQECRWEIGCSPAQRARSISKLYTSF